MALPSPPAEISTECEDREDLPSTPPELKLSPKVEGGDKEEEEKKGTLEDDKGTVSQFESIEV